MKSRGTFVIVYGRLFSLEYQSIDLTWRGAWPIRSRAIITSDGGGIINAHNRHPSKLTTIYRCRPYRCRPYRCRPYRCRPYRYRPYRCRPYRVADLRERNLYKMQSIYLSEKPEFISVPARECTSVKFVDRHGPLHSRKQRISLYDTGYSSY